MDFMQGRFLENRACCQDVILGYYPGSRIQGFLTAGSRTWL
jgi:hypothetical protein